MLSDLHLEFEPFEPSRDAVKACDVVVLAGDIDKGTRGITWAREAFASKPVVYVPGNHEFYGHDWDGLLGELRDESRRCNVHFLEDRAVDIEGVRFLGCALWTDFKFFPGRSLTGVTRACERGMNDFRVIRAARLPAPVGAPEASLPAAVRYNKRLTARHVIARHRTSVTWLREQLQIADNEGMRPVVVPHHLPSANSVEPKFANDQLTPSFASHLDDLIPGARLWIHGHTHASFDYTVSDEPHRESRRLVGVSQTIISDSANWR